MLIACYTDILHNTKARYTQSIVFLVLKLRTLKICNINMNTKGKKKIFAFFVLTDHVRVYGHVERFKNFCAMSLCLLDCPIPSTFKRLLTGLSWGTLQVLAYPHFFINSHLPTERLFS